MTTASCVFEMAPSSLNVQYGTEDKNNVRFADIVKKVHIHPMYSFYAKVRFSITASSMAGHSLGSQETSAHFLFIYCPKFLFRVREVTISPSWNFLSELNIPILFNRFVWRARRLILEPNVNYLA